MLSKFHLISFSGESRYIYEKILNREENMEAKLLKAYPLSKRVTMRYYMGQPRKYVFQTIKITFLQLKWDSSQIKPMKNVDLSFTLTICSLASDHIMLMFRVSYDTR